MTAPRRKPLSGSDVPEGILSVLKTLGPDLPSHEWAMRLGVPIEVVEAVLQPRAA